MRVIKRDVAEKPNKVHPRDVRGHAVNLHGKSPAGDVDPNTTTVGKNRGVGEQCRYHALFGADRGKQNGVRSGLDSSMASLGSDMEAARNFIATKDAEGHPLSADQKREEARRLLQDMMKKHNLEPETPTRKAGGWERPSDGRALTPAQSTMNQMRYQTSPRVREAPSPKQESYHARQGIRFHEGRARSATPDGGSFRRYQGQSNAGPDHAGRQSNSRLRHDTPGGQDASMGRVRSTTPDYHHRYRDNLIGSSLPGASPAAATPQTPRSARRAAACDPRRAELTASASSRHAARYHEDTATLSKRRSQESGMSLTSPRAVKSAPLFGPLSEEATPRSARGVPRNGFGRPRVENKDDSMMSSIAGDR